MAEISRHALAILRCKQVAREVGLSRSTIYQRIKDGTFPAPIRLGERAVGWRAGDIDRFLLDPRSHRASVPPISGDPEPSHGRR
jgi:prophage regulatory protein